MNRPTCISLAFAVVLLGSPACQNFEPDAASRAKLDETITDFYAAINSGETASRARFFTEEALLLPNGGSPIQGREAIRDMLTASQDAIFRIRNREILDMAVWNDVAYTVNAYEYAYHMPDDDSVWYPTKNIHIWRRQPDGAWQLHADLWNSSPARK
ncbi:MAG: DUF4440 domain-containing protein [Fidelibacterota bacterium]|nr:MAG: DUF4440 domain-containing protein [Candidatus Neomarinimicrobiota bacterium]